MMAFQQSNGILLYTAPDPVQLLYLLKNDPIGSALLPLETRNPWKAWFNPHTPRYALVKSVLPNVSSD